MDYLGGEKGPFVLRRTQQREPAMRYFNQIYVDGAFVTPHGKNTVDLINPTNSEVIGKVTMGDEIDTRLAIAAAKKAFPSFSQTSTAERMDYLQRLHDSV